MLSVPSVTQKDIDAVISIPGLKHVGEEFFGPPDVIAAAVERLKLKVKDIPSPWVSKAQPSHQSLRSYQVNGVATISDRLARFKGAILADDMGLGKTRQAVWVARELKSTSTLIICPASVRESWLKELLNIGVKRSDICICNPVAKKSDEKEWRKISGVQWVVTSYDLAERAVDKGFGNRYPTVVILDEAHLLRGRKTTRSQAIDDIAALATYRLALTGTPLWDRPRDLFKLLDIVVPRRFGSSFDFDIAYCAAKQGEHGLENKGVSNAEELKARLDFYMLRRTKAEVADELPPVTHNVVWLPASPAASAAFISSALSPSSIGAYQALHAGLKDKIGPAVELAIQARKFLLFTQEKAHAKEMYEAINKAGVPCVLVTGECGTAERQQRIEAARAAGGGVVATLDSCGVGVDGLQFVANYGIFHAIDWVPQKMAQACARLDRIGQTMPVQWDYLALRDSMDEAVIGAVIGKMDHQHMVMGGDKAARHALDGRLDSSDVDVLKAMYDGMMSDVDDTNSLEDYIDD